MLHKVESNKSVTAAITNIPELEFVERPEVTMFKAEPKQKQVMRATVNQSQDDLTEGV